MTEQRIRTTHTGSLPRTPELLKVLQQMDSDGKSAQDATPRDKLLDHAVDYVVGQQIKAGLDVINDGEMGKVSYATYVTQRLTGFGGESPRLVFADATDFPEWENARPKGIRDVLTLPACVEPVEYIGQAAISDDLTRLRRVASAHDAADLFMNAASPGVIALFLENQHYGDDEEYLGALAEAMKVEYDAVHEAGMILQIDCPDLAMGRHVQFSGLSTDEFRRRIEINVEALNRATRDIPPERMRMHLCWGNYPGPHHLDVPLADVLDIVLKARPAGIVLEAANPRHAHEWQVFEGISLPDGKVVIPGVIDSTTDYIEHPALVAERLLNYAAVVGAENVIGGTDCGFASGAAIPRVVPTLVYAKLTSLAEGARLASARIGLRHRRQAARGS